MGIIHGALKANRNYGKSCDPKLEKRPMPKHPVVTGMDPRLSNLCGILRLSEGKALEEEVA
jgi:hypothetical protein